jgi:soluble lytic murein transglycosylase
MYADERRWEDALALLEKAESIARSEPLRARCLAHTGKHTEAFALWERIYERERSNASLQGEAVHAQLQIAIALPFDEARLSSVAEHGDEFVVSWPGAARIAEVTKLLHDAKVVLRAHGRKVTLGMTNAQLLDRARSWRRQRELTSVVENVAEALSKLTRTDPLRCDALILAFEVSKPKVRKTARQAAMSGCKGQPSEPTLRMAIAKAEANAGAVDEADRLYASVKTEFGSHEVATDSVMARAMLKLKNGDERGAALLFETVATGADSRHTNEALFRAGFFAFREKRWPDAVKYFDDLSGKTSSSRHWGISGRAQYFRARTAELSGQVDDAKGRYEAIVRAFPLTHYMGMAYARLFTLDAARARATLDAAQQSEPTESWPGLQAAAAGGAYVAGLALLEAGDHALGLEQLEVARHESLESQLLSARLANRASEHRWAHAFAREGSAVFLEHHASGRFRDFWQEAFPNAHADLVRAAAKRYDVPLSLVWAIMREESAFATDAASSAKAYGLMQMIVPTAKRTARGTSWVVTADGLKTPEMSIDLGTKHLGQLRRSFKSALLVAPAAYNAGSGALRRWLNESPGVDLDVFIEDIPYEETRNYVKRVYASQLAYAILYAPDERDALLALPTLPR